MNATITEISVTKEVKFGGLEARLSGDLIFVHATTWRGTQPRLVLEPRHDGYADWKALLDQQPEIEMTVRFVGAGSSVADRWVTHEPSRLLS